MVVSVAAHCLMVCLDVSAILLGTRCWLCSRHTLWEYQPCQCISVEARSSSISILTRPLPQMSVIIFLPSYYSFSSDFFHILWYFARLAYMYLSAQIQRLISARTWLEYRIIITSTHGVTSLPEPG